MQLPLSRWIKSGVIGSLSVSQTPFRLLDVDIAYGDRVAAGCFLSQGCIIVRRCCSHIGLQLGNFIEVDLPIEQTVQRSLSHIEVNLRLRHKDLILGGELFRVNPGQDVAGLRLLSHMHQQFCQNTRCGKSKLYLGCCDEGAKALDRFKSAVKGFLLL